MLRIKDNIDLKELAKKYNFREVSFDNVRNYYVSEQKNIDYFIWEDTRIIEINSNNNDQELDDLLYDLIEANLVEKVGEIDD